MKKLRFLTNFGEKSYIAKLPPEQVTKILKVKLNMVRFGGNFGRKLSCPLCKEGEDTTEHVFNVIKSQKVGSQGVQKKI